MSADLSEAFGSELVLLGAADDQSLCASARRLASFLEQAPGVELRDVAYTSAKSYEKERKSVLALVASDVAELRARLRSAATRIDSGEVERIRDKSGTFYFRKHPLGGDNGGRLAFVFPGAVSFYPDMLRDLAVRFRSCRLAFDELEAALQGMGQFRPSDFVFPPAPYYRHDADVFTAGGYAEAMVATYSANEAMLRLLRSLGLSPDGLTGFSGGDLNALAASGLFGKFERKARLEFLRDMYRTVNMAVGHAGLPKCVMASVVSAQPERTAEALAGIPPDKAYVAFALSPRHITLAIASDAADDVLQTLAGIGARSWRLSVDRPFNTPWSSGILSAFRKFASRWIDGKQQIPVYSCGGAMPLPVKARKARDIAAGQWITPVRLLDTVRKMHEDGFRVFLEVGPRGTVTGFIGEILRGEEHIALACDSIHRAGLLQLQQTVGTLAALGAAVDPSPLFEHRRCRALPFDAPLSLDMRSDAELRLSRAFPHLMLLAEDPSFGGAMVAAEPSAQGTRGKASQRRAAVEARARRLKQQFDFGSINPLISDADVVAQQPGFSLEIVKEFTFAAVPMLADFALGTSQISHPDHDGADAEPLRGLTLLSLAAGAEIMAELAQMMLPNRHVTDVEDLQRRRTVAFRNGRLKLFVRAERVASDDSSHAAVHVQIREDSADSAWTWPAMEGTFLLSEGDVSPLAFTPPPLARARDVHWMDSDIYPDRLYAGATLRHIRKADRWSETGLDYEVEVPSPTGTVRHTRFPLWALNPQLMAAVTDGFQLWRSHEHFPGAFSYAFRLRRLSLHALAIPEGQHLHCYLRNTGVTPQSLITDIMASDGNGNLLVELRGYEEFTERVPDEYRRLLLEPASTFLTRDLPPDRFGSPDTVLASAVLSDVPYPLFERNEELWLKTVSQIVLGRTERREFEEMTQKGGVARRTEWLFGRIAAKEAVRRFLNANYQARWSDADVQIYSDPSGKPSPAGVWNDHLKTKIDISIAHTSRFVGAIAAANARVGLDVEALDRELSEEFLHGVFGPDEQELAVNAAADAPSAVVRFWCAKEAVSKALGTGIRYSPRELVVDSFRPETGEMTVSLIGQWLQNFKMFTGRAIKVSSCVVKGHVIASCFIPESMFR